VYYAFGALMRAEYSGRWLGCPALQADPYITCIPAGDFVVAAHSGMPYKVVFPVLLLFLLVLHVATYLAHVIVARSYRFRPIKAKR
jgi:hypothetical protein